MQKLNGEHPSSMIEKTVLRHEDLIDDIKENYHQLDKKLEQSISELKLEVKELRHDVKAILSRIEIFTGKVDNNDNRIDNLEKINAQRAFLIKLIPRILSFVQKYWAAIIFIVLIFITFDFGISVQVENPHLLEFLKSKFPF